MTTSEIHLYMFEPEHEQKRHSSCTNIHSNKEHSRTPLFGWYDTDYPPIVQWHNGGYLYAGVY